jgi:hypothetical protein
MSLPDILARIRARGFDPAREAYGDVVELPAAARAGGRAVSSSRDTQSDVRTHRPQGYSR